MWNWGFKPRLLDISSLHQYPLYLSLPDMRDTAFPSLLSVRWGHHQDKGETSKFPKMKNIRSCWLSGSHHCQSCACMTQRACASLDVTKGFTPLSLILTLSKTMWWGLASKLHVEVTLKSQFQMISMPFSSASAAEEVTGSRRWSLVAPCCRVLCWPTQTWSMIRKWSCVQPLKFEAFFFFMLLLK